MNSIRISPSFGRVSAADDASAFNQFWHFAARILRQRGEVCFLRAGLLAALGVLLLSIPGVSFAQHHSNREGGSREELSALTCGSGSVTGAGTDSCTVTLTEAASSGGFVVDVASSISAVTVPGSVTVAAGATSASFTATAAAVTSAETVTLTASDSRNAETYSLQLKPAATATTAGLTLGSTSVAFGDVSLNTASTQTVQLTSSGTAALTISAATVTGTGFTMSGITTPATLSPGQAATLNLQFDPTAAGTDTGKVTISSNAASGGSATISLSGTGTSSASGYQVDLSWDAPSGSSDPVAGYNIYRAANGSSSYQLLNTSVSDPTTYTDTTVQDGTSYSYEVMSVDASGVQSAPSGPYTVAIP